MPQSPSSPSPPSPLLGIVAAGGGSLYALDLGGLVILAVSFVAFAAIAVNWHRYILLDEVPSGGDIFRLGGKIWRYLGNAILIVLILLLLSAVVMVPIFVLVMAAESSPITGAAVVIAVPFFLFLAIFSFRLGVKLPAVALGRRDFTFSHALAATRGSNLALLLILLFQFVLAIGASLLLLFLEYLTTGIHPIFGFIASLLIQLSVNWILSIFGIIILTSLYGFFAEGRDF